MHNKNSRYEISSIIKQDVSHKLKKVDVKADRK